MIFQELKKMFVDGFKVIQVVMYVTWGLIGVPVRVLVLFGVIDPLYEIKIFPITLTQITFYIIANQL